MSKPTGGEFEAEFEIEIEAELTLVESSHAEEEKELPVTEWEFDPVDVERDVVGLRNLLEAAEELEGGHRGGQGGEIR